MTYPTDSAKWNAVRTKDPAANNLFVYCVKTTKIYCRPICKARLARRSNVEFFDTGCAAVASGYRACKRCRPELDAFVSAAQRTIESARRMLAELPCDAPIPSLDAMAKQAGLTKYHFHRSFKRTTGFTPRSYAVIARAAVIGAQDSLELAFDPGCDSLPSLSTSRTGSVGAADGWNADYSMGMDGLMPAEQPFDFDDLLLPEAQVDMPSTAGM